jgi:L-rhamnose mutarotase
VAGKRQQPVGTDLPLVRACFVRQVKPQYIEEYLDRHSPVWPEMLTAIHEAGWLNYSIFMRPDGLLVGYFESADPQAAQARMDASVTSARWDRSSAHLFNGGIDWLPMIFNLEQQLADVERLAAR